MRREIRWRLNGSLNVGKDYVRSDVELTFTRVGVEVSGYYDTYVGIGNTATLTWDLLDQYRRLLMGKEPLP